jgi:DNA polymerase-3 subunit alpha
MGTFVHLNGHSEYSTDGYARIAELVAAAKANGQDALALTDTNLGAAFEFRREAERHGIKPIIGLDVRLIDDRNHGGNPLKAAFYDLTLLAEDRTGWYSLVTLYNESMQSKTPGNHAYVDYLMLSRHAAGLIALTGGRRGPVDSPLDMSDVDTARANLAELENAIGSGRVFLEASDSASAQLLAGVFRDRHVLATARYRQAREADTAAREALLRVRAGRDYSGAAAGGWVASDAEMRAQDPKRGAWQNAVSMTSAVADAIDTDVIPAPERQVPAADVPSGFANAADYLRHLAFRGAADRYDEIPFEVIERLNLELERIISVDGATEYILAAHDLISWCRTEGILTASRGTSSSSLVLFCLGITDADPLRHGLKFARFLRAGRNALPHLDFDIQHSRRQDAYTYLAERWPGRVAHASSYARVNGSTVRTRAKTLLDEESAARVNGRIRYGLSHACAILIAPEGLHNKVPLRPDTRPGRTVLPIAAWDAHGLEDQGYMVLNLLFSSTLDVIARTAEAVRATPEGKTHMSLLLPDGDGDLYASSTGAAWDLIASADIDGVFQLGAEYAVLAAGAARPRNLTDMAALIALSGREDRLGRYLAARTVRPNLRSYHLEHITADESEASWICGTLKSTHGEIIFQEQIIALFSLVGGFSDAQAELAWRTLAKLSPDVAYLRKQFIEGAVQEQYDRAGDRRSPVFSEATAGRVFDLLLNATPGAFSAAHAYSYARLSFQTAWLRAHFPETFQRVLDEVQPRRKRRSHV